MTPKTKPANQQIKQNRVSNHQIKQENILLGEIKAAVLVEANIVGDKTGILI